MKIIHQRQAQFTRKLTEVPVGVDLPDIDDLKDEILGYFDVLLGREAPPVNSPYLSLQEVATAYYARALEIDAIIHEEEREGNVERGSSYYRFRTGALRSFIDASKRMSDLGSRRLAQEVLLNEQRHDAGGH